MYGASKAALESVTKSLAKELGMAPVSPETLVVFYIRD